MKNVIKFPASRRKLTAKEEQEITKYANLIHLTNQAVSTEKSAVDRTEELLRKCVKRIFELEEEI